MDQIIRKLRLNRGSGTSTGVMSSESGSPSSSTNGASYFTEGDSAGDLTDDEMDRIVESVLSRCKIPSNSCFKQSPKPFLGTKTVELNKNEEMEVGRLEDSEDTVDFVRGDVVLSPVSTAGCEVAIVTDSEVEECSRDISPSSASIDDQPAHSTPNQEDDVVESEPSVKVEPVVDLTEVSLEQSRRLMDEMLVSIKSRRSLSSRKYTRMCVFVEACLRGCVHTVVYYLFKGYINVNDELLCYMSALEHACYYGQIEVVKVLLEAGAKPNYKRKADHFTPLMAAACFIGLENDDLVECVKAVVEAGGKINVAQNDGMTALLYAASRSHNRIVEYLLDKGADIDHKSLAGNDAMTYAKMNGNTALKILLKRHMWVDPEIA